MPDDWSIRTYKIYSPHWLPNGRKDLLRAFQRKREDSRTENTLVVVPGWNKAPKLSAIVLQAVLGPALRRNAGSSAVLFTFPFYSHVAQWIKARFAGTPIAYHAHDPFEFYAYPPGYIRMHEDRLVPLCDRLFAIADKLQEDFQKRYPGVRVDVLGNAVSETFLQSSEEERIGGELQQLRAVGRPVIGVVGQINKSYDWDLLEEAAAVNPRMQLVFIGNLFEEGDTTKRIRVFFQRANVHWLGPKPHHELKGYMDSCDVLLNPLALNAQNDRRDTLRLYDYLSTKATVVSTAIDGVRRHGDLVKVPPSRSELIRFLGHAPEAVSSEEIVRRRLYLAANTWACRGRQLAEALFPRTS
jgi:hypothetical protein